ncbi:MAG: hypothetical protein IRY95_08160 [Clostridia bacterium]|nr:hypothetical protein [Clostridia bacterium]
MTIWRVRWEAQVVQEGSTGGTIWLPAGQADFPDRQEAEDFAANMDAYGVAARVDRVDLQP